MNLRRRVRTALLVLLSLSVSTAAQGAKWRAGAGLSGQLVYTDNIDLSTDDERRGATLSITPRVNLTGEGRRLRLGFYYGPSLLFRLYNGGENDIVHNMTADLWSELYRDVLFLNASVNGSLRLINPFGANPGDGINESDNVTQSWRASITPSIVQHYGGYADLRASYTYSRVIYDSNSAQGSDGHSANFSLTSGRRFQIVDWDINGNASRTEYDNGDYSIFAELLGRAGYRINRKLRANAYIGVEDNNFLTLADAANVPDTDGTIYGAGATWNPSPRTSLDFAVARRFFGTNLYFDFSHRSRRNVWTASLSHEPTNARNELLNEQTFQLLDAFGEPVLDPSGQPVFINPDVPALTTGDYVRRQLNFGYARNGRRHGFGLNAYYTKRDYIEDDFDTEGYGASASWSNRLMKNTNANAGLTWSRNSRSTDDIVDDTWNIRAGVTRQLSPRTNLAFNLSHRRRYSDDAASEYTENRATLTLGSTW